MTRIGGCGLTAKARGPANGTWSGSSPTSTILRLRRCGGRVGRAEPAGRAAGRQGAAVLTAPLNIGVGQK